MEQRNDMVPLKRFFILGQVLVLLGSMAVLFCVMALSHKDKILRILMSRLEVSAEAMAGQLKANQVPFSSGTGERGVFIIKQADGSMVVERHGDAEDEQKLWERYRTKLIYEMQKQKRGWIVYPDKIPWQLDQRQKIIRYLPIDEMGWILAVESARPTELELIKQAIRPLAFFTVLFVLFLGGGCFWFMTNKYFDIIKRSVADSVENNLMSLSGEEKMWDKLRTTVSPEPELQFEPPKPAAQIKQAAIPAPFVHQPVKQAALETFVQEKGDAVPKPALEDAALNDLTINVNNVKSSVLRKMIQKFRDK